MKSEEQQKLDKELEEIVKTVQTKITAIATDEQVAAVDLLLKKGAIPNAAREFSTRAAYDNLGIILNALSNQIKDNNRLIAEASSITEFNKGNILRTALSTRAQANATDSSGGTAIMYALIRGHFDVAYKIINDSLAKGITIDLIDTTADNGTNTLNCIKGFKKINDRAQAALNLVSIGFTKGFNSLLQKELWDCEDFKCDEYNLYLVLKGILKSSTNEKFLKNLLENLKYTNTETLFHTFVNSEKVPALRDKASEALSNIINPDTMNKILELRDKAIALLKTSGEFLGSETKTIDTLIGRNLRQSRGVFIQEKLESALKESTTTVDDFIINLKLNSKSQYQKIDLPEDSKLVTYYKKLMSTTASETVPTAAASASITEPDSSTTDAAAASTTEPAPDIAAFAAASSDHARDSKGEDDDIEEQPKPLKQQKNAALAAASEAATASSSLKEFASSSVRITRSRAKLDPATTEDTSETPSTAAAIGGNGKPSSLKRRRGKSKGDE